MILGPALIPLFAGDLPVRKLNPVPTPSQLIEQLGSSDFRVREAANKSLEELGLAALEALRGAQPVDVVGEDAERDRDSIG